MLGLGLSLLEVLMETTSRSSNPSGDGIVDRTPLLAPIQEEDRGRRFSRRPGLRGAARFLRRASGRRVMREQSMRVREAAAEQLEERQSDWAYSRPVVILDIIWNLAFVIVAFTVLVLSRRETVLIPLRLWIVGYAMQCVLHMICVCIEFRRRQETQGLSFLEEQDGSSNGGNLGAGTLQESYQGGGYGAELAQGEERTSVAKHLESANTMFSFIWWIIGFYWVSAGGQNLARSAPQLYWLCIVFLAFDVFFVVFCVAVACVVGIAVCCCLPCIIAILYAIADQEGATEEDICQLPKYKFRRYGDIENLNGEISGPSGGIMSECGTETPIEHVLSVEDAECCICISAYDDGVELRELPCSHHFHSTCIDKWLFINATCPLCKFNILKGSIHGREDV